MLRSLATPTLRSLQRHNAQSSLTSRTLVSGVLLNRDAYDGDKVAELKTELKQRGLSTQGRRADLIRRLLEDDKQKSGGSPATAAAGTPAPSPASAAPANKTQTRMASTKRGDAKAPDVEGSPSEARPSMSSGNVGVDGQTGATVSHPPDMEPGQVSSNAASAIDAAAGIVPEKPIPVEANPPGVPPQHTPSAPITFEVKVPYEAEVPDAGPEIPLVTSYFHPETPTYEAPPIKSPPKVITVSGEGTFPHGGGVSHSGEDGHFVAEQALEQSSATSQSSEQGLRSAFDGLVSAMRNDLGLPSSSSSSSSSSTAAKTTEAAQQLRSAAGSLLQDAKDNVSKLSSGSNSASYSTSTLTASASGPDSYSGGHTRQLNDEEQRGLYTLGALVAGGFVLGSLGKPSKRRVERLKAELEQIKRQTADEDLAAIVKRAEEALKSV